MPMTIDQGLLPAAIVEYHAAKDHGADDAGAMEAAVLRVRHDVLQMAALLCQQTAAQFGEGTAEADGCHACFNQIQQHIRF